MGILLRFMFLWNMIGALVIPALSYFLLPTNVVRARQGPGHCNPGPRIAGPRSCRPPARGLAHQTQQPGSVDRAARAGVELAELNLQVPLHGFLRDI